MQQAPVSKEIFYSRPCPIHNRCPGDNNRVILAPDVNEHVIDSISLWVLKNLGLIETHVKKFNLPSPASYVTGSTPIDSI